MNDERMPAVRLNQSRVPSNEDPVACARTAAIFRTALERRAERLERDAAEQREAS